jgi:uncharacterized membrane-anchored protein YitT (DUF2179 family)
MAKMDITKIISGALAIIVGLVLLPVMANFTREVQNNTTIKNEYATVGSLLNLVMYGFAFGLVGLGVGLIYIGYKGTGSIKIGKKSSKKRKWWKR